MAMPRYAGPEPNPTGLCMCGCGESTQLASRSSKKYQRVIGKPVRFIRGHSSPPPPTWKTANRHRHRADGVTVIFIVSRGATYECLIDSVDYPAVEAYRWSLSFDRKRTATPYARCNWLSTHGKPALMHLVLNPNAGRVDHKNRNGLDNRRQNMRLATASQNGMNSLRRKSRTGYRGVARIRTTPKGKKFMAYVGGAGTGGDVHIRGYQFFHYSGFFLRR